MPTPHNGSKLHATDQTPRGCPWLSDELGADAGDAAKSEIAEMRGSPRLQKMEAGMDTEEDGRGR